MKYRYNITVGRTPIRTNLKKHVAGAVLCLAFVSAIAVPALAIKPATVPVAAPKATGGIGWVNSGAQAYDNFNVQMTSTSCYAWSVNGTYTFDFEYLGGHYVHDATISNQSGGGYDVAGGYPAGEAYAFAWEGTGTVVGSSLINEIDYTVGAVGTHMHMSGTIAPNGTMSGAWSDNYNGDSRTGTWATASGAATKAVNGCTGKGSFTYSDANGINYVMDVKYANVSGTESWFAGPTTSGNFGIGTWIFIKVADNGEPGVGYDQIWGQATGSQALAKDMVATMATPASPPFMITSGNVQVH